MQINYNGGAISAEEIIRYLTISGMVNKIVPEIIKQKEAPKKAAELRIEADETALQKFADNFRYLRGLHSASATRMFFEKNGWTLDDFDGYCESAVLTNAVKDHLAGEAEVEKFFVEHRADYDMARISEIVVANESLANEIKMQVAEDDEDFFLLAKKHSSGPTQNAGGTIGWVARNRLAPEVAAKVLNADDGDVLGPFRTDGRFRLILVEEVRKADLRSSDIKQAVKDRIFDQWAAEFYKDGIVVVKE